MKITKELKFIMQLNSFIGCVASVYLIHLGVHLPLAYVGLGINGLCLIDWIFIAEDTDNEPK